MLRRDFLKTVTATAMLTATLPVQAKETPTMSNANFADVNGQHILTQLDLLSARIPQRGGERCLQ
jgi:hypothetical protein